MLHIINNNSTTYHIVGHNFSDDCERFAASELQKYIYQSTDTFVPYFSDRCQKRGGEIVIGAKTRDFYKKLPEGMLSSLGDEGFLIKTIGEDLLITGNTSRGTLYGVYTFLEKFMGFRAFTKDVEKISSLSSLSLDETEITEKPAFEYREAYFRFAFDGEFCVKNKLNGTLADISREKGGNFKFFNCHHSFEDLVPPNEYFEKHPEYYAEIDEVRKPTQLCLSNPEVLEIAKKQVRKWIKENPHCKVFSVAQSDNDEYCRCEKCRKTDEYEESPAGSVISFVNKIAEDIEADYPDVLIHTFAYLYSKKAPKHIVPHKNIIVRLCNIECDWGKPFEEEAKINPDSQCAGFLQNICDWSKICNHLYIWDYAVNFANYAQPFPIFEQMAENIRAYHRRGIKGVLEQGNFSYGGGVAMDDLKSYLIAKLLWNPDVDLWQTIDEFCDGVYGKGSDYIKEYLRLISSSAKGHIVRLYDYPDAPYITDELVNKCDDLFAQAQKAAENNEVLKRIEREHLSIEYLIATRTEDFEKRCALVDVFAKKIKRFKITELMERRNLNQSFTWMKNSLYTKERPGEYNVYYIVR